MPEARAQFFAAGKEQEEGHAFVGGGTPELLGMGLGPADWPGKEVGPGPADWPGVLPLENPTPLQHRERAPRHAPLLEWHAALQTAPHVVTQPPSLFVLSRCVCRF